MLEPFVNGFILVEKVSNLYYNKVSGDISE